MLPEIRPQTITPSPTAAQVAPASAGRVPRADRLTICSACPEKKDLPGGLMRCGKCGCICQFKAAIPAAKCPLSKW